MYHLHFLWILFAFVENQWPLKRKKKKKKSNINVYHLDIAKIVSSMRVWCLLGDLWSYPFWFAFYNVEKLMQSKVFKKAYSQYEAEQSVSHSLLSTSCLNWTPFNCRWISCKNFHNWIWRICLKRNTFGTGNQQLSCYGLSCSLHCPSLWKANRWFSKLKVKIEPSISLYIYSWSQFAVISFSFLFSYRFRGFDFGVFCLQ